jgi:hypothetical protein
MKNLSPSRIIFAVLIAVFTTLCVSTGHYWQGAFVAFCGTNVLVKTDFSFACIKGIAYDVQLTNFAHGIAPDYTSALAELMAPQCVAPAAAGQYVAFDDDDAFRYVNTRRALGGKGARLTIDSSAPTFSCEPHSIEIPIDSFEGDKVGEAGMPMLREAKTRTLVSRNALSREKRVFAAYEAGVAAEAGPGVWTDADVDPIDELDAIVADLATGTGNADIHMVFGLGALQQIRKHPKVIARFPGAQLININANAIQNLLIMPVKFHVGILPIVMEKVGKAGVKANIVGAKVYALLTQPNPSPFDPSAAKTFTTRLGQVDGVGMYLEPPFAEINFMAWSEDIKITGSKCVKRIDVTIGAIA